MKTGSCKRPWKQEIAQAAVRIASAAGFSISVSEITRTTPDPLAMQVQPSTADELESIDFDGDGIPDAVIKDGRWVLLDSVD